MPHVFLGERHVHMSYVLICIMFYSLIYFSSKFSVPYLLHISMSKSGGARHLRERNHSNSLHIFTLGDMSNLMWYLVLTLYMSSQSWYSCGFRWFALASGCTCVI